MTSESAAADPEASSATAGVTLREVLAFDDSGTLRLLLAPAGQDVPVLGTGFAESGPDRPARGFLLIAVDGDADAPEAAALVRRAARQGACAVVLRDSGEAGPAPEVLEAAREAGIAVLARAAWAEWTDTATLLRSALAFGAAGRDPQGPPADDWAPGGLSALAATIAGATGGAITIEDTSFRVLAHSATRPEADGVRRSTILGGRVPEWRVAELRRSGLLRTLRTSREVIHRPADADGPERLIVAVRSGAEVLGSIWVAADGRPLLPGAARALRSAAVTAAPHLVRHRLRESGEVRRHDHALRGLLHGAGDLTTHAWSLGLAPSVPCAVVAVDAGTAPAPVGPAWDRTLDVLALHAASYRPAARVLRERERLLVLLPVASGKDREALGLARELATLAASLPDGVPVLAGAGAVVPSALGAPASYEEASLVVRVLREKLARGDGARGDGARGDGARGDTGRAGAAPGEAGPDGGRGAEPDGDRSPARWASAAELGPAVDVRRMLDAVGPVWEAGSGPLHALVRADLAAGGELVRSLAAYLDAAGDITVAARRLVLHPNTLRYRLRRARERHGVDVDDPDTRLLLTVAVRLAGGF
ncbi:helix-turn-helix domain-containing protein [Streptomyces sp. AM 2-1-1]|uniref:helix-turn-helix domain-containing protein n=1 Tax=Streptomyces sp. AM 2-1-1 TaxID=3028709 RepID=UPI0023B9E5D7|nr:helix-turn-helix domain-containing protein [Streptomyces sp. AM 2-1-1]WEH38415.1 helix-turn-helix domain-containing protein [Streptomyces sp. AM 2-1-1]